MKRYILFIMALLFVITVKGQGGLFFIGSKAESFEYSNTAPCNITLYEPVKKGSQMYYISITKPMRITVSHNGSAAKSTAIMADIFGNTIGETYAFSESSNGECSSKDLAYLDLGIVPPGMHIIYSSSKCNQQGNITTTVKGTLCDAPVVAELTKSKNYILTTKPVVKSNSGAYFTADKSIQTIDYYDAFGYPEQSVQYKAAPNRSDLVTYQEYDYMFKEGNSWLPVFASGNNGKYIPHTDFVTKAATTYANDAYPYSKPVYDTSPLKRIIQQFAPGKDLHENGKAFKTEFLTNSSSLVCKKYVSTNNKTVVGITDKGNYPAGSLYVTKTTNEEGKNITYEFTNKLGQVVLVRQMDGTKSHDTYYVYDSFSNLRAVLPPLVQDATTAWNTTLDQYAYLYKYDGLNRQIGKKLPGAGWTTYRYDKADRMIFSQDAEQATSGKWTFYLYDNLSRVLIKGECTNTNTASVSASKVTVSFTNAEVGIGSSGYTSSFAITSPVVHQVNYYDDYNFRNLGGFRKENFPVPTYSGKGKLTGSYTALFNSSMKLRLVNYYDNKGNLVDVVSTNLFGGHDKTSTTYTFTGKPLTVTNVNSGIGITTQTQVSTYTYDHVERLKTVTHKLNNATPVTLVNNTYDNLGRLQKNSRNGVAALADNYTYNIRSQVTQIKGTQFTQDLTYKYNGDIASMQWTSGGQTRKYTYTYDALSRLTAAAYTGASTAEKYNTAYTYDKHGNIKTLQRYGKTATGAYGIVDNLTMTYVGNQLTNVADAGTTVSLAESNDFKKGSTTNPGYAYNKNGAMTKDLNKKISSISYNSLSLPNSLVINGATHTYTYAADGRKFRVDQGGISRDYVGNIIYENRSVKRILVNGGYWEGGVYYFNLNDHLGNVRAVANASGTAIQRNHYYPFGLPMAETTTAEQNKQPYKYNSKEFDRTNGLNLYDYHARQMDPAVGRFTTMDPLAEKYYSISPYAYVMNNPMRFVDPDGCSTWVMPNANGTYRVIGGNLNDKDFNIYLYSNLNGDWARGKSIGVTSSITSFYDSDNGRGAWAVGSIIDPNDQSGSMFLNSFFNDLPELGHYMENAINHKKYDFKSTNGGETPIEGIDYYRGMPIGKNRNGMTVYSSARDIGNIAAGYIAGAHGIPWIAARREFDKLQTETNGDATEGISSQNAQRYGWNLGNYEVTNSPVVGLPVVKMTFRWMEYLTK